MLLKPRADDYQGRHPGAADVLLLVELSDSSLVYDRGTKLPLYAKFGVPEVWIVDLGGAAIEVYREPAGDAYALQERLTSGIAGAGPRPERRDRHRRYCCVTVPRICCIA